MKAALICPIPDLERFVCNTTQHLLLAPLFESRYDPNYQYHYANRRRDGEFITIDNGAYRTDGGKTSSMARLLELAQAVRAQEVVLPDVIGKAAETKDKGIEALRWLYTSEGQVAYDNAGRPDLMVVPQGHELEEWSECLQFLIDDVTEFYVGLGIQRSSMSVGISKLYGEGILQRLETLDPERHPVHLLGWAGTWNTTVEVVDRFPWVRSMDSARPVTYAKHGLEINEEPFAHPSRDADYFEDSVIANRRDLVARNIQVWRELIGDE